MITAEACCGGFPGNRAARLKGQEQCESKGLTGVWICFKISWKLISSEYDISLLWIINEFQPRLWQQNILLYQPVLIENLSQDVEKYFTKSFYSQFLEYSLCKTIWFKRRVCVIIHVQLDCTSSIKGMHIGEAWGRFVRGLATNLMLNHQQ